MDAGPSRRCFSLRLQHILAANGLAGSVHSVILVIFDRLQHLASRKENRACAQYEEYLSDRVAVELVHVNHPAFDGSHPQRVGYKEDLGLGLDLKQARQFFHTQKLASAVPVPVFCGFQKIVVTKV